MPTLKVHYDGWLSLPARLRQALGVNSGDRLEAEVVDGTLVLRTARKARSSNKSEEGSAGAAIGQEPAPPALTAETAATVTPAKRKPGRPRKDSSTAVVGPAPEVKRPRGRPRKAAAAPAPDPAVVPPVSSEPWKLRKKADLKSTASDMDQAAPPARPPAPARRDHGFQTEERRPFRHVEVRKIGPGRRHKKREEPNSPVYRDN